MGPIEELPFLEDKDRYGTPVAASLDHVRPAPPHGWRSARCLWVLLNAACCTSRPQTTTASAPRKRPIQALRLRTYCRTLMCSHEDYVYETLSQSRAQGRASNPAVWASVARQPGFIDLCATSDANTWSIWPMLQCHAYLPSRPSQFMVSKVKCLGSSWLAPREPSSAQVPARAVRFETVAASAKPFKGLATWPKSITLVKCMCPDFSPHVQAYCIYDST